MDQCYVSDLFIAAYFYILSNLLFINHPTILQGANQIYIYKYILLKSSFQGSWYEAIFITWL